MGYNIGVRIVEDFLARTTTARCTDMKDTAEKIQSAFKMYLGVNPTVTSWSQSNDEFSLIFEQNPMTEFVELPENFINLKYCNLFCGIVRGACEMVRNINFITKPNTDNIICFIIMTYCIQVQLEVSSCFVQDSLKGDPATELRVKFVKKLEDAMPAGED